ncbi:unnamed protein product [Rhodiola kirilowii]
MKELWGSIASLMGVLAFSQTLIYTLFPPALRFALLRLFTRMFFSFSSYCYFDITEIDGVNTNELYNAVQLYLSSTVSISASRLTLTRALNSSAITFGLATNDIIADTYNNIPLRWEHVVSQRPASQSFSWRPLPEEKRRFTLRIMKKDKDSVLDSYLEYITQTAADIRRQNQDMLLYTNSRGCSLEGRGYPWESVPFIHPSTFDTLAMDPDKKDEIMNDLNDFASGQSFYQKAGRAWKRGYLLYGPPGTGKSSMIAAMANFLGYDIYDLELTEVQTNSELRKLLMKTSSKSIIVIEDIDCSINLTNRNSDTNSNSSNSKTKKHQYDSELGMEDSSNNTITLSGLLNFTDGLWSCCGSERIFVFTTNHIEKLDPALMRSGRMDMHIFMSYCSFNSLKILLNNYLDYSDDDLARDVWDELEKFVDRARMTPADVSEHLIKHKRNKAKAVKELIEVMKLKAEKNAYTESNVKGNNGMVRELDVEQEKRELVAAEEEDIERKQGRDEDENGVVKENVMMEN